MRWRDAGDSGGGSALDIDIESLVTEDDTPVDNMPSEKQQRLLTEPLYSSCRLSDTEGNIGSIFAISGGKRAWSFIILEHIDLPRWQARPGESMDSGLPAFAGPPCGR